MPKSSGTTNSLVTRRTATRPKTTNSGRQTWLFMRNAPLEEFYVVALFKTAFSGVVKLQIDFTSLVVYYIC
jgi:hypothetical protein